MVRLLDRRSFLATGATAGTVTIAGCGQDSESTEGGTEDSETDSTEEGGETDDSTGGEETQSDGDSGGDDGVLLDLNLTVGELPDAFESLVIEFSGLELFSATGQTITRESDPVQADLTALAASGDVMDLMKASVPADTYDNISMLIAVTEATVSDDDSEQTFRNEEEYDGEVTTGFSDPDLPEFASGDAITVTSDISVEDHVGTDWRFEASSSIDRES